MHLYICSACVIFRIFGCWVVGAFRDNRIKKGSPLSSFHSSSLHKLPHMVGLLLKLVFFPALHPSPPLLLFFFFDALFRFQ